MNIRSEKKIDIDSITKIHDLAFNGMEEGIIVKNLRESDNLTISLVYEGDGGLIGHVGYSLMHDKNKKIVGVGLAPLGVLPDFQKNGVGRKLVENGNKIAQDLGHDLIFVLGDPQYYLRFGFELAREYNYFSDYDPEGNHFMVMGVKYKKKEKVIVYYSSDFDIEE